MITPCKTCRNFEKKKPVKNIESDNMKSLLFQNKKTMGKG